MLTIVFTDTGAKITSISSSEIALERTLVSEFFARYTTQKINLTEFLHALSIIRTLCSSYGYGRTYSYFEAQLRIEIYETPPESD